MSVNISNRYIYITFCLPPPAAAPGSSFKNKFLCSLDYYDKTDIYVRRSNLIVKKFKYLTKKKLRSIQENQYVYTRSYNHSDSRSFY